MNPIFEIKKWDILGLGVVSGISPAKEISFQSSG
jgi:hypothetical protein